MGKIWRFNDTLNISSNIELASTTFTSNGTQHTGLWIIRAGYMSQYEFVRYGGTWVGGDGTQVYYHNSWNNDAYRVIEFDNEPSGTLLTFLQSNAKQISIETYAKLSSNNRKTQVDSAIEDGNGNNIAQNYASKSYLDSWVSTKGFVTTGVSNTFTVGQTFEGNIYLADGYHESRLYNTSGKLMMYNTEQGIDLYSYYLFLRGNAGTRGQVVGVDNSGFLSWINVSGGGTQLYKHSISCSFTDSTGGRYHSLKIISPRSTAYTGFSSFDSTSTVATDVENSSIVAVTVGDNNSMGRAYGTIIYAGNMISDFKILVNNVTISLIAFEADTVTEL